MGLNASSILISLKGIDGASSAIKNVSDSLSKMQAKAGGLTSLKSWAVGTGAVIAGVATAAVGCAAAIKSLSNEYSNLDGRAKDAGISAENLQGIFAAMQQANIKGASLDSISNALAKMQQTTGQVGEEAFVGILKSIAQMSTAQERSTTLSQIFGEEMGLALRQITDGGEEAINALFDTADATQVVSENGVQKFVDIGTAWAALGTQMHTAWSTTMLAIVDVLENSFGLSIADMLARLGDWLGRVVQWLQPVGKAIIYTFKILPVGCAKAWVYLQDTVVGVVQGLYHIIANQFGKIAKFFTDPIGAVKEAWENGVRNIEEILEADSFADGVDIALGKVGDAFRENITEPFSAGWKDAWEGSDEILAALDQQGMDIYKSVYGSVSNGLSRATKQWEAQAVKPLEFEVGLSLNKKELDKTAKTVKDKLELANAYGFGSHSTNLLLDRLNGKKATNNDTSRIRTGVETIADGVMRIVDNMDADVVYI